MINKEWLIKVTQENKDEVFKWLEDQGELVSKTTFAFEKNIWCYISIWKMRNVWTIAYPDSSFGSIEIEAEEVLKPKIDSWCVQVTEENREIVKKWKDNEDNEYTTNAYYGIDKNGKKNQYAQHYDYNAYFDKLLTTEEFYKKIGHIPEKKSLVGRYLKALVDNCNGTSYKKGDYILITVDNEKGTVEDEKTFDFGNYSYNWKRADVELMPEGFIPPIVDMTFCGGSLKLHNLRKATQEEINSIQKSTFNQEKLEDRIKELSKEELLEEAKRRYPFDTVVRCLVGYRDVRKIINYDYNIDQESNEPIQIWFKGEGNVGLLIYNDGKWAERIPSPNNVHNITVQTQSVALPNDYFDSKIMYSETHQSQLYTKKDEKRINTSINNIDSIKTNLIKKSAKYYF